MVVTLVGIVTDVSDVHESKAQSAMEMYWVGIVNDPIGHEKNIV